MAHAETFNLKDAQNTSDMLADLVEKINLLMDEDDELGHVLRTFSITPNINMWSDLYGSYAINDDGTLVVHCEVRNGDLDPRGYAVVRITPAGKISVEPTSSYGFALGKEATDYIERVSDGLDLLRTALTTQTTGG